jgi:hypothetical protein
LGFAKREAVSKAFFHAKVQSKKRRKDDAGFKSWRSLLLGAFAGKAGF